MTGFFPLVFERAANPLLPVQRSDPFCHWHSAVFARLYQRLVRPHAAVQEVVRSATGPAACRFVISPGAKAQQRSIRDNAPLA
jgi:divinyl protochlorophyllide a 8-vinyl-reductase